MNKEGARISCATFQKQELVIKDITDKINAIEGVTGKVVSAEILRNEVDVLLACQSYKNTSADCENCRFIASLRKRAADLIIKVKKLA